MEGLAPSGNPTSPVVMHYQYIYCVDCAFNCLIHKWKLLVCAWFAKYAAIKDFSYWKDRVEAIDDEKRVFKYSVIEGGLIGKKVKSTLFELRFEDGADGGSVCKFKGEYETIEDSLQTEDETKEMMGSMVGMFKAIEGYLIANPDVYV